MSRLRRAVSTLDVPTCRRADVPTPMTATAIAPPRAPGETP
ncbi:hypothetical protein BSLA_01r2331 [Burkholderia stabilis]|nr:hypothetical protein BSLA_01r2331 [Burkholderia stabilis]